MNITPTTHEKLAAAAELLAALAYPVRLKIIWLLAEQGQQSVNHLAEQLAMDQSAISHQLRILRQAKLVITHRDGRQIFYQVTDQHVVHIIRDAVLHANE